MKIPKVINPIEARHISALLKFRAVVGGKKTPHLLAGRLLGNGDASERIP